MLTRFRQKIVKVIQTTPKPVVFSRRDSSNIVIASMPKSASSYFRANFENYFSTTHSMIYGKAYSGIGNNFLSREKILRLMPLKKSCAVYGHIPLNQYHDQLLTEICPEKCAIIILRSLPDTVISYYDHIVRRGKSPLDPKLNKQPEGNPRWNVLSETMRFDFIIRFIIPWYVSFVSSWIIANDLGWKVRFVTFESHTNNVESVLSELNSELEFAKITPNCNFSKESNVNFNQGRSGRGLTTLSHNQIVEIRKCLEMVIEDTCLIGYLMGENSNYVPPNG